MQIEQVATVTTADRPSRKNRNYPHGLFEKLPGSRVWWIRYADSMGRIRREKAGTKSAAIDLYRKRKTEALQGKKLPESLRKPAVSFAELAQDALAFSKTHKRTYEDDVQRMPWLMTAFRERSADSITPRDLEHHLAEIEEERGWAPASVNRYRALISLIFRLGIENGKVKENPARLIKSRVVNNARTRWLSPEEEICLRAAIETRHPEHLPELELALNTGLRLGEIYSLTWENVNLFRRVLTILRSKNGQTRHVPQYANQPRPLPDDWQMCAEGNTTRSIGCQLHRAQARTSDAGRTRGNLGGYGSLAPFRFHAYGAPAHTLAAVERLAEATAEAPTGTKTSTSTVVG